MSFVISLYVREGIVMAADSRLTLNAQQDGQVQFAVAQTDSVNKLFVAFDRIGIATFGQADIDGVPIGGFIESFIAEKLQPDTTVAKAAELITAYFNALKPDAKTYFHVAGYHDDAGHKAQQVWLIDLPAGSKTQVNPPGEQGAQWGGDADIMTRLIQPIGVSDGGGNFQPLPHFPIPWGFFTLQDAIDFANYAVGATIDSFRFQPRPKTVGGPIDVLVIRASGATWIQRKQLHP